MNQTQYAKKDSMKYMILRLLLSNGAMPYDMIDTLPFNRNSVQHALYDMKKDGVIKITRANGKKHKKKKIIILDEEGLDKIVTFLPAPIVSQYVKRGPALSKNIRFGEISKANRIYKSIEASMMFDWSRIPSYPDERPEASESRKIKPFAYYTSTDLKAINSFTDDTNDTNKKITASRITGVYNAPGGTYGVYNVEESKLHFINYSELKFKYAMAQIKDVNNKPIVIKDSIIFFSGDQIIKSVKENQGSDEWSLVALGKVYENSYLVPMNKDGKKMLQILGEPNWHDRIINLVISKEFILCEQTRVPCDGFVKKEKKYMLFAGITDINNLQVFYMNAQAMQEPSHFVLICFEEQYETYKEVFGDSCQIETVKMDDVIKAAVFNVE